MKRNKWTGLCLSVHLFSALVFEGVGLAADSTFPVYLSWAVKLASPSSTSAHIAAASSVGDPFWIVTVNSPKPASFNLFSSGQVSESAVYRAKDGVLAFRAPLGKQETLDSAGWPANTISSESSATQVSIVPGKELAALVAQATLLRAGIVTPEEFRKNALKSSLKKYTDHFLTNALFGEPLQIKIPVSYEIQVGEAIISASGELTFSPAETAPLSVTFGESVDGKQERLRRIAGLCRKPKRDKVLDRYCRMAAYGTHETELRGYFTGGWKGATKVSPGARESVDNFGRTFLMRLVSNGCGLEPKVGASGFHSGTISEFEIKKKILSDERFSRDEINERDFLGRTPLHYALHFGCVYDARWLLANGARPEIDDFFGNPTLMFAALSSDSALFSQLLSGTPSDKLVGSDNAIYNYVLYIPDYQRTIPMLVGHSPLVLAVANRNYSAVEGILKRKPKFSPKVMGNFVHGLVFSKDARLLKIAMESGIDLSQRPDDQSAAVLVAQAQATPDEREKYKEFYRLLADLFEKHRVGARNRCLLEQQGRTDCFSKQGLCSEISSIERRDRCYVTHNQCERIESGAWRWRCRWMKGMPFDCEDFKLDEFERASCELRMADKEKSLRAFEWLLKSARGTETLLKDGQNFQVAFGSEGPEQATRICNNAKFLHVSGDYYGVNGYRFCAGLIGRSKSTNIDLKECRKRQDDSCFWEAVYLRDNSKTLQDASLYLKDRCAAGNLRACALIQFVGSEEELVVARRACELGARNIACFMFLGSPLSSSVIEDQVFQWALEGDTAALQALQRAQGPQTLGRRDRIAKEAVRLEALCRDSLAACHLLYDHFTAAKNVAAAQALVPQIQRHASRCVDSEGCYAFRGALAQIPVIRDFLLPACKKGNYAVCEILGAENEDPLRPGITLAQLKEECPATNFAPNTTCHKMAAALVSTSSNDSQVMRHICPRVEHMAKCTHWLEATAQKFAFSPEALKDFERLCSKDGFQNVCLVVGKHHLKHDAVRAASFLKKACEGAPKATGDCMVYVETLARLQRPKDLNRYLEEYCSRFPGHNPCAEKGYYQLLAGEKNGYDKILSKQCEQGDLRSCHRLKEFVDTRGGSSIK